MNRRAPDGTHAALLLTPETMLARQLGTGGFGHHPKIRLVGKKIPESCACHRVIVYQRDTDHFWGPFIVAHDATLCQRVKS